MNIRNGYRYRDLDTRVGTLDVAIPKLRTGSYFPEWLLERRRRAEAAHICETCDNYTPAPEFALALASQLADTQALHADAEQRGWTDEVQRHQRTAAVLQAHLRLLEPH